MEPEISKSDEETYHSLTCSVAGSNPKFKVDKTCSFDFAKRVTESAWSKTLQSREYETFILRDKTESSDDIYRNNVSFTEYRDKIWFEIRGSIKEGSEEAAAFFQLCAKIREKKVKEATSKRHAKFLEHQIPIPLLPGKQGSVRLKSKTEISGRKFSKKPKLK